MTGTPYSLTSGRISCSEASSPVTEFTIGRPGQTASAAARAFDLAAVDAQGHVDHLGHGLHREGQHGQLVHTGGAHVDVEDVGSGRHLGDGLFADHAEVTGAQRLGQAFLAGGVDALADQHGGTAASDDDLAGRAATRVSTSASLSSRSLLCSVRRTGD